LTEEVSKEKEKAIKDIKNALGDEKTSTGALGEIVAEKKRAVGRIEEASGNGEAKTGALGAIVVAQKHAIDKINEVLGATDKSGTALFAISDQAKASSRRIAEAETATLKSLPSDVTRLKKQLDEFEPIAIKVREAHQILSEQGGRVSPTTIVSLLRWSLLTVLAIGFVGGVAGVLVPKIFRRA
jgi:hypothetical protein